MAITAIDQHRRNRNLLLLGLAPLPMALLACLAANSAARVNAARPEPPCWGEADCEVEMSAEEAELLAPIAALAVDAPG
jgi:hypothetical protein